MSVNYEKTASDWHAACVGSAGYFAGKGAGIWAIQLLSPTVCTTPVLFAFTGAGIGFGKGVSVAKISDSKVDDTNSRRSTSQPSGFSKIKCNRAFSLEQLDRSGGRLTVGEAYIFGHGGGVVIVTAFDRSGNYFNSQNLWGSGLALTKASAGLMTTVGVWKMEHKKVVHSRPPSSRPKHEQCSIYDIGPDGSRNSIRNLRNPNIVEGPTLRQGQ